MDRITILAVSFFLNDNCMAVNTCDAIAVRTLSMKCYVSPAWQSVHPIGTAS